VSEANSTYDTVPVIKGRNELRDYKYIPSLNCPLWVSQALPNLRYNLLVTTINCVFLRLNDPETD